MNSDLEALENDWGTRIFLRGIFSKDARSPTAFSIIDKEDLSNDIETRTYKYYEKMANVAAVAVELLNEYP